MKTYSEVLNSEPLTTFSWALGKMPVITMVSVTVSVTVSVKTPAKREGSVTVSVEVPAKQMFGETPPGALHDYCDVWKRAALLVVATIANNVAQSLRGDVARRARARSGMRSVHLWTPELCKFGRSSCAHSDARIVHIWAPT